jgi:hypothetical protein
MDTAHYLSASADRMGMVGEELVLSS